MLSALYFLLLLMARLSVLGQQVPQTPAQIEQQKRLADHLVMASAPAAFRSPLKAFETYFALTDRAAATEFQCMTDNAIKKFLEEDDLTKVDWDAIRAGRREYDAQGHTLVEFRYTADPKRPKITFSYSFHYRGPGGQRITRGERERVTLIQTATGWKIDFVESDPLD